MEDKENKNKALCDQMKEHQERVDMIPGAPKLLPKRDVGRFVEQPYSEEADPHAIPKTFKMPLYLKIYDGTTDPEDHIIHYATAVKGNDLSKEQVPLVLLKKFGKTLTGGDLTWYSQLPARSIATFEEMADKFVTAHVGAKKAEARVNDIFAVRQSPGEGLRDFLARFNRVRMSLPNVSEGMAVAAFQNGLSRNGSRVRADEDDLNGPTQRLTSVQAKSRKYHRNDDRKDQPGPRLGRERHQPYIRTAVPPPPRHTEGPPRPHTGTQRNKRGMPPLLSAHNFCVSPSEIVYALEKLGTKVKWLQKMKSDPNTRKSDALCEFHQERGHKTEDCIGLRQEVIRMLNQGHLRELMSDRGRANFGRGREQHQGPLKPPSSARTVSRGDEAAINHLSELLEK
ncbi:PREDICTED: uncharacterized protein LOC109228107 [Nicotiana attenuata]|uniref:uncharacterized protein LOC109228107 n=1 Tax=Nicotiana attenuata TaxID=49451 RepID=UPI0009050EEB|nr:PREDICTED: uncharacterized protein LOC109228107 [Nicotiana attenuata]